MSALRSHALRHLGPLSNAALVLGGNAEHVLLAFGKRRRLELPLSVDCEDSSSPLPCSLRRLSYLDRVSSDVTATVGIGFVPADSNRLFRDGSDGNVAWCRWNVYGAK